MRCTKCEIIIIVIIIAGFFLTCEDFGRMFDSSFPACAYFFLTVEISLRTLIPLFSPGSAHSGSVSWDDFNWAFPDELRVSSFSDSPLLTLLGQGCLAITCHLRFLVEWLGSFTCHCSNTGLEWTLDKESAHKVDSGAENSPTTPARIWTCNLSIKSGALTNKLSWLPDYYYYYHYYTQITGIMVEWLCLMVILWKGHC